MVNETTVVIGAQGRIGRMLNHIWKDRSHVRWVSRTGNLPWSCSDGAARLTPYLEGANNVLCLAGATPYDGADLSLNQRISDAVIEASEGLVSRVFLASSAAVYGDETGPHSEDSVTAPTSDYGRAKLAMEQTGIALGEKLGVPVTCLRIGNMVGADMWSRNVTSAQHIVVDRFSDGLTPRRSFLDPQRFATILEGLFKISNAGGDLPNVLNVASPPALAMADLLEAAERSFEPREAGPAARAEITMDLSKLFDLLPQARSPVSPQNAIAAWRACEVAQ